MPRDRVPGDGPRCWCGQPAAFSGHCPAHVDEGRLIGPPARQLVLKDVLPEPTFSSVGHIAIETRKHKMPIEPVQLGLPWFGRQIDVDQRLDDRGYIQYIGKATHVFDDVYRCLANVAGALCVVEVTIRPLRTDP